MQPNDKEIIRELKSIHQELQYLNEKLEDLGYLRHLKSINDNLTALNPQIQKQIEDYQKLQNVRIMLVSGEISEEEAIAQLKSI